MRLGICPRRGWWDWKDFTTSGWFVVSKAGRQDRVIQPNGLLQFDHCRIAICLSLFDGVLGLPEVEE